MPSRSLVNLDAMISRADFAIQADENASFDTIERIGLRDLSQGSLLLPILRKPDFQRETNHWSPEQVVSLLECFVGGDLIPSVILWKSPLHLFVIDGGHRLSVLRAWIENDYGDGPASQEFFGYEIPKEQKRIAKRTRDLIEENVGKYADLNAKLQQSVLPDNERKKLTGLASRALPIQWVGGNAEKAEASFFKINTEGTPLDDIEELLLRNRRKPIAIAARAVIRAGKGHRYWSAFPDEAATRIEKAASQLHQTLFDPEVRRPVKTLDLPLGGSKGVRTALQALIDFMLIANRNQQGKPAKLQDQDHDLDGDATVKVLSKSLTLAGWITGNSNGSLGLHPAVYFYGPSGVHSGPMFMGTVALIGRKLANNDSDFFRKFTKIRASLEESLIIYKDLIATILQKQASRGRTKAYENLLGSLIDRLLEGGELSEEWLVEKAGVKGKVLTGTAKVKAHAFTDDVKSQAFISVALQGVPKCNICTGFLDSEKSLSYDHDKRKRDGGGGDVDNIQLTHPYCNQSIKS
jgi:Protein of unknown function DUF262